MKEATILLLSWLTLFGDPVLSALVVHRFGTEDLPVGYALDEANVLETIAVSPGNGQTILCSLHCKASGLCRGFLVQDGYCKTYTKLSTVADASVMVPISSYVVLHKRVLLLRHDKTNGGNFPLFSSHGSWYLNENDPEAPNYSIFGDVDSFKDKNGVYHFEMCYPKYPGIGDDYCFVFEQTSDPRRSSGATENFVLHSSPSMFENSCPESSACKLKGLIAENQNKAWLDGNPETSNWCYAAGTSNDWPTGSTAFPGFCDSENGNGHHAVSAYFMELYTYIPGH